MFSNWGGFRVIKNIRIVMVIKMMCFICRVRCICLVCDYWLWLCVKIFSIRLLVVIVEIFISKLLSVDIVVVSNIILIIVKS